MIQFQLTKKFFNIFTKPEKILFFLLIFIQLISAALELISIGALLPVFKSITDPNWNEKYFGFLNEEHRTYYIFLIVIAIFIIKVLFLTLTAFFSGKFRNKVTVRVVNQIYENYLNKNYQFHTDNSSSLLLRNMQYANGIDSIIMRIVDFYADLMILLLALQWVLLVNFKVTLAAIVLIIILLFCYSLVTKAKIEKFGNEDVNYNTYYIKNMMEGIQSYKEILLSGRQKFFTDRNKIYKQESLRYKLRFTIVELVPKYLVEILLVTLALIGAIFIMRDETINLNESLPFLGILFVGIIKTMPNILRLFNSHQQFKYLIPQMDIIYNSIVQIKESAHYNLSDDNNKKIQFESNIQLKNINFDYKGKNILRGLNLEIKKNSTISIQGSSGSGKTTLLNILTGLLLPTKGSILLDENNCSLNNNNWQKKIGYLSQNTHLLDDTIKANIAFGFKQGDINHNLIEECLEKSELNTFIESLPEKLDTIVGENGAKISGGQLQRIGLARVFYNNPELLILDEPTNSLDSENEIKIVNTLKKLKGKITIIIVSHNEKPLEIADEKFVLKNGSLIKR